MNLWLRLIYWVLVGRWRRPVGFMEGCETPFRCWPADLDTLLHMNNSRYLAVMDLARVDYIRRCGLWSKLQARGQYPIVEAQTIRYRKSIRLWQRFAIVTKIIGWDEKSFYVTQTFVRGGEVIAEAVVKGRFLKRTRGTVPPSEIVEMGGGPKKAPKLPAFVQAWNDGLMKG
jgi:acyl-CoA thioesterase FadM